MFLWPILIVALIVYLFTVKDEIGIQKKDTPMDILKKRYASGEISKEEFEEMKKDLE